MFKSSLSPRRVRGRWQTLSRTEVIPFLSKAERAKISELVHARPADKSSREPSEDEVMDDVNDGGEGNPAQHAS